MTKKEQLTELIKTKVKQVIEEVKRRKKRKKPTLEGMTVESHDKIRKDDLGRFYVVTNPSKNMGENLIHETDLFNFTEKIQNGSLKYENIRGIFSKQESANRLKEKLVRERTSVISDAKKSAERLKSLRDEVSNKAGNLKKLKAETQAAVSKINENKRK